MTPPVGGEAPHDLLPNPSGPASTLQGRDGGAALGNQHGVSPAMEATKLGNLQDRKEIPEILENRKLIIP